MSNVMGRPKIEWDNEQWEQFKELCSIQCNTEEISNVMDITYDTLVRLIKEKFDTTYSEAYKRFSAGGKISLRRAQLRLAQTNAAMGIWLGKQWLGQRDFEFVKETTGEEEVKEIQLVIKDASDVERVKKLEKDLINGNRNSESI
jgi:hypothetical protein